MSILRLPQSTLHMRFMNYQEYEYGRRMYLTASIKMPRDTYMMKQANKHFWLFDLSTLRWKKPNDIHIQQKRKYVDNIFYETVNCLGAKRFTQVNFSEIIDVIETWSFGIVDRIASFIHVEIGVRVSFQSRLDHNTAEAEVEFVISVMFRACNSYVRLSGWLF